MKTTEHFKRTIQCYLENRAMEDELFAKSYHKQGKSIDDCITYMLNEIYKGGCNGLTDGEVYSLAVHYYDEDNIEIGNPLQCHIAVNHVVELTEEEKAEARQEAIRRYQREQLTKMQSRNARPKKAENAATQVQQSLFDF